MHSFRSKTHILGICTSFRCSKMSVWFRTTYFMSKTRVSGGFTPFYCRTWPIAKISIGVHLNAWVYASETISCFVTMKMPNPLFQSKTHVLGGSMPLHSRTWHIAKTDIEAHLMHEFMPLEPFFVFLQYRGAFKARVYALDTISCLVATNMLKPHLRSKAHVYNSAWYLNALFT